MTTLEQEEVSSVLLGRLAVSLIKSRPRDIRQSELSGEEDIWPDVSFGSIVLRSVHAGSGIKAGFFDDPRHLFFPLDGHDMKSGHAFDLF